MRLGLAAYEHGLRLSRLLLPSEIIVTQALLGLSKTHLVSEAARLELAEALVEGPRTTRELAQQLSVNEDRLARVLHALVSHGIFARRQDGRFVNNRASRVLMRHHPSRLSAMARYFGSPSNSKAWSELGKTVSDGRNGFEHALGAHVWQYFAEHAEEARVFDDAMMGLSLRAAPVIARAYPWANVSTVCDVGGGAGTVLAELLVRHPHLRGVLCDAEAVVQNAAATFAERGLSERVELTAADFFQDVPTGADVYLLKNILHDWDDTRCVQLLCSVRRSMAEGARLLLAERFLHRGRPDPFGTLSDVQMMVVSGEGRERTQGEYGALLGQAGFVAVRSYQHPIIDLLEASPA
jgi:hypothetical protein